MNCFNLSQALADRIAVSCTLVRGEYNRAWNEVMLQDDIDTGSDTKVCYLTLDVFLVLFSHCSGQAGYLSDRCAADLIFLHIFLSLAFPLTFHLLLPFSGLLLLHFSLNSLFLYPSLSPSLSVSLYLSPSLSASLYLSLSISLSLHLSLPIFPSPSLSLSLPLSLCLSLYISLPLPLSPSLSLYLPLSLSLSLSLPLSPSLSPSPPLSPSLISSHHSCGGTRFLLDPYSFVLSRNLRQSSFFILTMCPALRIRFFAKTFHLSSS